jgi:hypothetical protein
LAALDLAAALGFSPLIDWGVGAAMSPGQTSLAAVKTFLGEVFGCNLPAKRILSLSGATLGAIKTCSLAVSLIGQGLALAGGLETKHAVKQVDRMLSNAKLDVDALLPHLRYAHNLLGFLTVH